MTGQYYIRTSYRGEEYTIYGYRLQPGNFNLEGYATIEKAKAGLARMEKRDEEDELRRDIYEIVNWKNEIVWKKQKGGK